MVELRVIPEIRSADFERTRDRPDRTVLYLSRYADLDLSSVPPNIRRVGLLTAWTWAFRDSWRVIELPEPLWLRALPLTMSRSCEAMPCRPEAAFCCEVTACWRSCWRPCCTRS